MKDISIGTKELSITPFMKDAIAISGDVFFDIIGRVVSIDVAPAGAIAVKWFNFFAKNGIVITAIISLNTFVKNAMVPILALSKLVSITADKLYHPNPAAMDKAGFIDNLKNIAVIIPPVRLPIIIESGIKSTFNPFLFKSFIRFLLLPTSIPTNRISKFKAIVLINSILGIKLSGTKKYPHKTPINTDKTINKVNYSSPFCKNLLETI